MSRFKPNDMVLVIDYPNYRYPPGVSPGAIGTISERCNCPTGFVCVLTGIEVWKVKFGDDEHCFIANVLRKIEPPKAADWDWRTLVKKEEETA